MSVFGQQVAAVQNRTGHDCLLAEQQKQKRILNTDFSDYEN